MTQVLRKAEEKIAYAICVAGAVFACILLIWIIGEIFLRGLQSLTWYFIFTPESATPNIGMGIANAIIGSILISVFATIFATPLALGTAIYLQKYAKDTKLTRAFRFLIEALAGTPSIVLGMFALLVFAYYMKYYSGGLSLLSGSIALAILILPVIERSIEDAITRVPREYEEGSYAMGASKLQTIFFMVIPCCLTGILTGMILGFGRAAEESAVVILTAGYSQFMPEFAIKQSDKLVGGIKIYPLQDLVGTLPYSVYHAYENSNIIPMSNGFAAAFILICIVFLINLSAKFILSRTISGNNGKSGGPFSAIITSIRTHFRHTPSPHIENLISPPDCALQDPNSTKPSAPEIKVAHKPSFAKKIRSIPPMKWLTSLRNRFNKKETSTTTSPGDSAREKLTLKQKIRPFLRALLPFTIPAAIVLIFAFLTTIPPLHHALGPVNPWYAMIFAIGLFFIFTITGVVFALMFTKKEKVFKGKNRRIAFAGVATGICLLLLIGTIGASASYGIFSIPVQNKTEDRSAQLAALMAEIEEEEASSQQQGDTSGASSPSLQSQTGTANTSSGVLIPLKDALTIGESYHYGDVTRISEATVYDYQVLPFYFWWFIDYNRFVMQVPQNASSKYLVVFVRIENIGTRSAIVPSADQIRIVTANGSSYSHEPYFDMDVVSAYQAEYYSSNYNDLPYQWIRELGQDKRDYAYLTGYNIFGGWEDATANSAANTTLNVSVSDRMYNSTSSNEAYNGKGFFIKPGPGNAIDGYLIFEVPDSVVKEDLDTTYVDIVFNANSRTKWRLKTTAGQG